MSKILPYLYVGDVDTAHSLFEPESQSWDSDETPSLEVKGVISACFDVPRWCNDYSRCDHQNEVYSRLIKSPHYDPSYIDLHIDRIPRHSDEDDNYVIHMSIKANDARSEPLYRGFLMTFEFIESVESIANGATYVHCMMGMSRSCSLVCAYLMKKYDSPYTEVLNQIRRKHPIAMPSDGFVCQLILFYQRDFTIRNEKEFWSAYRNLLSTIDLDRLEYFETKKSNADLDNSPSVYGCAKCRQTLFYAQNVIPHVPGDTIGNTEPCSSVFVEPMDWMVDVDGQSGKIICKNRRCSAKLGFYCWHGRRCSCGYLQVPAFQIQLSKVDKLPVESSLGGITPNRNDDLL
ncbi:Dual specificity phosphatase catalytic domain family protein [Babesia bovis T2Bo]|uniref:protein-tyrosine-phosphatase n=1 Tax=Babesia bovis TaxID=5865 RepID=A7ANQ5_BABBO|nr:Dual specificity phosphatase catalytic domain family protein [Babesia bovis T2Bo]EDO08189.1 Dual specificity phosphatase catalytic domain family protein [Babesia bovis T2Bo]|eukprot:XP_001611757.1 dual specificity phosphatase, catalytic domain containing protein [Babesia bovis T2Bo]